jgi:hypothetical protein
VKVDWSTLENNDYEGANNAMYEIINALDSTPGGIPKGSIYSGGYGVW